MRKIARALSLFFIGILLILPLATFLLTPTAPLLTICRQALEHFTNHPLYVLTFALCCTLLFLRFFISKIKWLSPLHALLTFFDTLEHELSHLFVGLLHGRLPQKLSIDLKGNGAVHLIKPTLLIFIAPYLTSLWLFFCEVIFYSFIFSGTSLPPILTYSLRGALWGNFIYRLCTEVHRQQPDLREGGFLFSLWVILCAQLFTFALFFVEDFPPSLRDVFSFVVRVLHPPTSPLLW